MVILLLTFRTNFECAIYPFRWSKGSGPRGKPGSKEKLKGHDYYAAWVHGMRMVMIREGTRRAVNSPDNMQTNEDLSDRALAIICPSI